MRLYISVAERVLDSIALDTQKAKDQEYIEALCRLLLVKHELTLLALLQEPTFYIQASSSMEHFESSDK